MNALSLLSAPLRAFDRLVNSRVSVFSLLAILIVGVIAFGVNGCATTTTPGAVTSTQQTIANAVEDSISIGLVPVLSKNPSYIGAAKTVSAALGSFTGSTLTPDDVASFLTKVPQLSDADRQVIGGMVNAAWGVYVKRYAQQVNANVRPDVKLFLSAVANGIESATNAAYAPINAQPAAVKK
jgi:hypothetical protein